MYSWDENNGRDHRWIGRFRRFVRGNFATLSLFGIRGYSVGSGIRCLAVRGARNTLADRVKILLDMNLSPSWIACLESGGHSVVHWSSIGSHSALDTEIMAWARENGYIVFTNDVDYGALLFATAAASPSVIQIRTEDIRPPSAQHAVLFALQAAAEDLSAGALVTIDPRRLRISTLPLRRRTAEPS